LATINAKLMSKAYAKRLKIIIKMYYDADQEVFLKKGTENSIDLSFSLYVTNIFTEWTLDQYAEKHSWS
jgi:hypothetical protein